MLISVDRGLGLLGGEGSSQKKTSRSTVNKGCLVWSVMQTEVGISPLMTVVKSPCPHDIGGGDTFINGNFLYQRITMPYCL